MSNRCPLREEEVERFLKEHGESSLSEIAAALGIKPATVSNYVQALRRAGRATNTGKGCQALWRAGGAEPTPAAAAIEQVSSVWHYAERMR